MAHEVISECPVCHHELKITRLNCPHCLTEISGDFKLSKLASLSKEQLVFVEIFLKNRGNIKDCEKDLGVSYPTVRRLLNDVLSSLGYQNHQEDDQTQMSQKEIIKQLENGEISVKEAQALLKKLRTNTNQ